MSIQKNHFSSYSNKCYNLSVQLRCPIFSVNQLLLVKKGLYPFLLAQPKCQAGFYSLTCSLSMDSKRLVTGLIFLFASLNGLILKQIMKRTKCTSTQIIIMYFHIFLRKISTLAYFCIYQDVTVCRLFLCAKINPESHCLINKTVKMEKLPCFKGIDLSVCLQIHKLRSPNSSLSHF